MAEPALLREYVSHLAARAAQGQLAACADPALKARARRLLGPGRRGALDVRGVAERCRRARGGRALRDLLKALELLELLCVNLLLCPWRREIRSLKTFTGNFVYYIQPVLPEDIVKAVLEKIGYVATTATEFSLVEKRNNEEMKQTAFEIFLARLECEAILEVTNEEKHGNLEKSLQQQGTQTHRHQGEEDEEDQTPQRGDTESLENEGNSETPLCLAPQQKCSATCAVSFEAAGNLRIKGDVAQSAAAASPTSLQEHQRKGINAMHLPGKCSDSEDFLIKYSDIVIGQTPIFGENLSPKALEKEPRASLSEECALAVAAESAARALGPAPLSPGASGPPAFAMFADSCCDNKTTLEFEAPEIPEESIEAEINDAINCIDPAPRDEPTELKSLPYKDFAQNCSIPREEDVCELSLTFTKLQIKDAQEELMYPVEETGQPEAVAYAGTSERHLREFNHSQIKHTYLTDAELHKRAASHTEPSSGLCCTAGHTEDSTTGSDSKRLFVDPAKAHPASECFRHVREPPNLTYIPPQSIDVQPSHGGRTSTRGRSLVQPGRDSAGGSEGKLQNCNSPVSDTQEPYVIIDRTEQAMLCHHT
ncbi:spermatogenesis-associated protein 2-like protein [Corvus moneduloides]|uniref:Spermatogenesis-associated protein 2 PUB-like domain-containing protein n=1 Tax=Corvus moneduloides TaxID=1196302 RepID=A0A8U7NED6_CORMO|nr:spermatogenesis-associated protein 2-like protein [Corvus moneduloides]